MREFQRSLDMIRNHVCNTIFPKLLDIALVHIMVLGLSSFQAEGYKIWK